MNFVMKNKVLCLLLMIFNGIAFCSVEKQKFLDAVSRGDVAAVQELIDSGVDISIYASWALYMSSIGGYTGIVKILLHAGVDKDSLWARIGKTPLCLAAINGYKEIVETLLKAGANKDYKDENGATPLYYAALYGQKEIVEMLIRAGADVTAQTCDGFTAASAAEATRHSEVAALIKQQGAIQRALPFLSGFHVRLGEGSPVQLLGYDGGLAEYIIRLALSTSGKTQPELP